MDDIPVDPENESSDPQLPEYPPEGVSERSPADLGPDEPRSRWKKRALWAVGIAAGAAAAVLVYLKVTDDRDDPGDDDASSDSDQWVDDDDHEDDDWPVEEDDDEDDADDDDWIVDEDLRDYLDEQDEIVTRLAVERETLDDDERQSLYDQLDVDHQIEASDDLADWADDAVGHPSWRSDD